MNRRKEACRNFQRGSCQYGDRCKFLHATQQQPKSNPFGFGTQSTPQFVPTTQQQKPNPFGFGVQNSSQSKAAPNFSSSYQSPAKPFENKWTRPTTGSTPSQQTDTQSQIHKCTDPESCKRIIVEDFKNEAPLWKLTCYGHFKYLPCDIVGDASFEELRAAAYEDARKGLNLQSIVERERNLLNSKLAEFDNLVRNPYVSRNPSSVGMPGTNNSSSFPVAQSNAPTSVSSFTQFGGANSSGPGIRSQSPVTNSSSLFPSAQSNAPPSFSSFTQLGGSNSSGPGIRSQSPVTPSGMVFGQPILPQNTSQTSSGFGMNFGVPGVLDRQPIGSSPGPSTPGFSNGAVANGTNGLSFPLSQQLSSSNNQLSGFHFGPKVSPTTIHEASMGEDQEDSSDHGIWLKEEWDIGEIPEQAPPLKYC